MDPTPNTNTQDEKPDIKTYEQAKEYFISSFAIYQSVYDKEDKSAFMAIRPLLINEVLLSFSVIHNVEFVIREIQRRYRPNTFCLFYYLDNLLNDALYQTFLDGFSRVEKSNVSECDSLIHSSILYVEHIKTQMLGSLIKPLHDNPEILESSEAMRDIKTFIEQMLKECHRRIDWIYKDLKENHPEFEEAILESDDMIQHYGFYNR
jgi:hypothetical protein